MIIDPGHAEAITFGEDHEDQLGLSGRQAVEALSHHALKEAERIAEALVFASASPVSARQIASRLPEGVAVETVMANLARSYAHRGVNVMKIGDGWAFRTASDLAYLVRDEATEVKKLSRAGLEVLAIIAYHQPVTRAEIEDIRGVATSRGTLDVLLEASWVRMRGRRRSPGRPVTYGTTAAFLDHFGLEDLRDLPGMEELKGAGLLSSRIPSGFQVSQPPANDDLADDEDPITRMDLEELGLLTPMGEGDD